MTGSTSRPCCVARAEVFEYPMIDREPVPTWVEGNVVLLGDAAHVMYPTGSNGASQAIIDARVLGAAMLEHGVNSRALQAYDTQLCAEMSQLVLRNRGAGPFGLLNLLDDRCGGVFDNIDDVIPKAERDEFMLRYKTAAGFAAEKLNAAASIIPAGLEFASNFKGQSRVTALHSDQIQEGTSDEHIESSAEECWP